jgi:hypothetical protein
VVAASAWSSEDCCNFGWTAQVWSGVSATRHGRSCWWDSPLESNTPVPADQVRFECVGTTFTRPMRPQEAARCHEALKTTHSVAARCATCGFLDLSPRCPCIRRLLLPTMLMFPLCIAQKRVHTVASMQIFNFSRIDVAVLETQPGCHLTLKATLCKRCHGRALWFGGFGSNQVLSQALCRDQRS